MSRVRTLSDIRDPQVRAILDSFDLRGTLAPMTIAEKRASVSSTADGSGHNMRIGSVPVRVHGPLPAERLILYFHGGGFVSGSIDTHDAEVRRLGTESEATVISVEYRLAPEHRWPAPVEDCVAVLEWAVEHYAPARIFVAGDSAGGNLAAVTALWARDHAIPIAGQILVYPMTDATMSTESLYENALIPPFTLLDCVYVWQQYLPDACNRRDWKISPLLASDLSGLARAVVITAEFDILRSEGDEYARRLGEAGVMVEHWMAPDISHGFMRWSDSLAQKQELFARAARFVRSV